MRILTIEESDFLTINQSLYPAIKSKIIEECLVKRTVDFFFVRNSPIGADVRELYLYGKDSYEDIPSFTQPLLVEHDGCRYMCSDVRNVAGVSRENGFIIRSQRDFDLLVFKNAFMALWVSGDMVPFKTDCKFAGKVFVETICGLLSQQWNLDMGDSYYVKILTALYFGSRLNGPNESTPSSRERDILRWTKLPSTPKTDALRESAANMNSFSDLVDMIKEAVDTQKIKKGLTTGALLTGLSRTMYGLHMSETLTLASDFPPIFAALVATTLDNRTYTKTALGGVVDRSKRDPAFDEMVEYVRRIKFTEMDVV